MGSVEDVCEIKMESKLDVSIVNYSFAIDILLYVVTVWLVFSEILQLAHHCSHQRGIKSYCCSFWSLQQNFSIFLFLYTGQCILDFEFLSHGS